ncbi:hypothetical protein RvY_11233-2 [Ramazzottius varieornatus]|uniref:Cystatin domain-containing protein n=1 Tax=Ramazzottius varieornatus TaxID=947166 RepID=A0A1D1VJT8_RAMVA|nr:hypothetical protein RvY_11233-2 [Ramazzottius varieornatus]
MLILQALCYRFCLLLMEIQIVQKAGLRTVSEFVVVRYTTQVVGGINYNLKVVFRLRIIEVVSSILFTLSRSRFISERTSTSMLQLICRQHQPKYRFLRWRSTKKH